MVLVIDLQISEVVMYMRRILIENHEMNPGECSYGFPWKHDVTCYNFRAPEELVLDKNINHITDKANIETLVIGCDLEDYDFISDMVNLRQLYIYSGNNLNSIAFIKNLVNLQQLYIVGSHIDTLDDLVRLIEQKKKMYDAETDMWKRIGFGMEGICMESDCDGIDGNVLFTPGLYIGEVIMNHKRIRAKGR